MIMKGVAKNIAPACMRQARCLSTSKSNGCTCCGLPFSWCFRKDTFRKETPKLSKERFFSTKNAEDDKNMQDILDNNVAWRSQQFFAQN